MIAVPLARDGEPFLADAGSVTWSLRDHTGALVPAYTNQPLADVSDTTLLIPVPAAANAVALDRQFEKRTLAVKGTTNGQPFIATAQYRLTPWLNFSVTVDAVRGFIGTDAGELPDADIQLVEAYYDIQALVGATALTEALDSGTRLEQLANDAIKGRAVLRALPGVRQRLLKRSEDGVLKAERFAIDFEALARDAQQLVNAAARDVGNIDNAATAPTLFVLATPTTDLFPGA